MNLSEPSILASPTCPSRAPRDQSAAVLDRLPDHRGFVEHLDYELGLARAFERQVHCAVSVVCLNLDALDLVAERYGQQTRDTVVRIIAARLVHVVRPVDQFGRIGSEEFACIAIQMPAGSVLRRWAHRLHDAASTPIRIGPVELRVQPSIGMAVYPGDGNHAEVLLANARRAMVRVQKHRTGFGFYGFGGDA